MLVKTALGIVAVVVGMLGYGAYIRDIFRGQARPHIFTWFVWSVLMGTAFFAQVSEGGGAGAWVSAAAALVCLFIAACSFWRGEKNITSFDWLCFAAALVGITFWKLTDEPLSAIFVVIFVDVFAFIPTFRKTCSKPLEETYGVYAANVVKYALALFALESYNLVTWLYPAYLAASNGVFVLTLWTRRRSLMKTSKLKNAEEK